MAFVDTEQRQQGEVERKVGRLRLSEAIRIGALLRPQCRAVFWSGGGSCALGAAVEATGGEYGRLGFRFSDHVSEHFPDLDSSIAYQIFRRNDSGESRESIADWLESKGL